MQRSANLATPAAAFAVLLKTSLKRCGGGGLLLPKGIFQHCSLSLAATSAVAVLLQTWRKAFAGTGAPKQRAKPTLQTTRAVCCVAKPYVSEVFIMHFARVKSICSTCTSLQ